MSERQTTLERLAAAIALTQELSNRLKVEEIDTAVKKAPLAELARLHAVFRESIDSLGEAKSTLQKTFDWLRISQIPERMEAEELESISIEGVGRLYLTTQFMASIKGGAKDGAYQYLTDHGHGDIIQSTVNASSLKALAKQKMKDNDPLPSELFNVNINTAAVIQKK